MPLDTSIPLQAKMPQFDDPLTVQAKRLQLSDLMGRQQSREMEFATAKRAEQERMTLADVYRESAGDPTKTRQLFATRGLGSRIPAFDREQADLGKSTNEAESIRLRNEKTKMEVTGAVISSRLARENVTPEDVISDLQGLVQRGFMDQAEGARLARMLPPEPEALRRVLLQAGMEVMDASKRIDLMLPKTEVRNMGGADQVFRTDQLTGQVTPGQTFGKSATPDAVMSDARQRAEGAANRGVQLRGQTLAAQTAADGRVPAGYRMKNDNTLEAIPGGPADLKSGSAGSKVSDANEAIQLINQAEPLLKGSTGSYAGVAIDTLAQAFGVATQGAINSQQLKAIEGALVAKMPKMSGPQSDKDVALYRQMAAVIGDATIPYAQKSAALEQVRAIQERYAGVVPGSSAPAKPSNPSAVLRFDSMGRQLP